MGKEQAEAVRRIVTRVYIAMLAAVGVYALLPALLPPRARQFDVPIKESAQWGLLATGAAQYGLASVLGRRWLRSRPGTPLARVRSYFLIRFAAAEAIGIFGFVAFLLGAPASRAAVFLAVSAGAFLLAYPGRAAFAQSLLTAGED